MIKLCVFDMGGVLIRNFHIAPSLLPFLGCPEMSFSEVSPVVSAALKEHSRGMIDEATFWSRYTEVTGRTVPVTGESLLGKFFSPVLDAPTVGILRKLKARGVRVVCGTNVIESHYQHHIELKQYDVFDYVYPSHLMHIVKPDEAFFQYICEQENTYPHETFFTDDMEENVLAAKAAGLVSYLYVGAKELQRQLEGIGMF